MASNNGVAAPASNCVDYDLHGLVGVRLLDPTPQDAAAVARQLGPLQRPLTRQPDIVIRFVRELPTPSLRLLGLEKNGFTREGFFILRSSKQRAKVKIGFEQIGRACEIVCESGLRAVPLLMAIINLAMLQKDCVPLHASAFVHRGVGVLVTGWAKGGKTEALLSFAQHGARFVGDEWIVLSGDGRHMYGIPENIRLWDWHFDHLPHLRRHLRADKKRLFKMIHLLDNVQKKLPLPPLREAMPALRRQLNAQLPAQTIFGENFGPLHAVPQKVFLLASHAAARTYVEPHHPEAIARQMIASLQYEFLPFMEHYLAFAFAFPERRNAFIENAHLRQLEILQRALAGKEAYTVWHPYPFSFQEVFEAMRPFCESQTAPPAQVLRKKESVI